MSGNIGCWIFLREHPVTLSAEEKSKAVEGLYTVAERVHMLQNDLDLIAESVKRASIRSMWTARMETSIERATARAHDLEEWLEAHLLVIDKGG